MEKVFFIIIASLSVAAALSVVAQRNTLYSAFSLIGLFGCLAVAYITLQAHLIAAIQVIVYAGAIMVLFVFVIMLLNIREEELRVDRNRLLIFSVPLGGLLFGLIYFGLKNFKIDEIKGAPVGTSEAIGQGLFSKYLLPFEVTSILILLAIVGSVVLARREKDGDIEDIEDDEQVVKVSMAEKSKVEETKE
ncbi:MAG: NADH-quinone oxidoreductase subunit J [Blastocatellia bacterium]|nr:NADH-quinone oxidoreductase subunit J [Blastocatellia bacterium]